MTPHRIPRSFGKPRLRIAPTGRRSGPRHLGSLRRKSAPVPTPERAHRSQASATTDSHYQSEGTMALQNLDDLYLDQIRDLYSAETQIVEALPKMIEATSHDQLRAGFEHHLDQTREHVRRLEQIA